MTEIEYIIQNFDQHFSVWQGHRIALSSGEYLEEIVKNFDRKYSFCCILGSEDTEVPDGVEVVILTDRRTGKEPDYHRVRRSCQEKGLPLLDLFGLDQQALHRELAEHRHLTLEEWKDLLSEYEVVSLFIPHVVADFDKWEDRWRLRHMFPILYDWMESQGKTVVIFWENEDQLGPLKEAGIDLDGSLFRREGNDLGFLRLAERFAGRKIIHVGVGTVRDGIVPREYGMDSRVNRYFTGNVSSSGKRTGFCEDKKMLIKEIEGHDVISFDIFDTLIKRSVLYPKDVFAMTEEQTGICGFADLRYQIQTDCPELSLKDIYVCLRDEGGYDDEALDLLLRTELAIEKDVIMPRDSMVEIFRYAERLGKTIVLVSDMYMEPGFLHDLLETCGITGYSSMHISCEYGKLKGEGLFEVLGEYRKNGETVLHIGDDQYADVISAERYGLDACLIASCLEMAKRNGYAEVIEQCRTLGERKLLGLGIAAGFDDPFVHNEDVQTATAIIAPLAMSYLHWVCGEMLGKGYDRFLLFSRDGWMLLDAYRKLQRRFSDKLPPVTYFYANRHAALMTILDDYLLVRANFRVSDYEDDPAKLLQQIFRIPAYRLLPYGGEPLEEYYRKNITVIRESAESYRKNYRQYLTREGLLGGKCAVMDFVSEGSSQRMLESILNMKMDGYYVGVPEYAFRLPENIHYFMDRDLMDYETEMKLEVCFTSPEPALDHIGEDGEPVFADEVRDDKTMDRIRLIQGLVHTCLDQYLEKMYDPGDTFEQEWVIQLCDVINRYGAENYYYDDLYGQEIGPKL